MKKIIIILFTVLIIVGCYEPKVLDTSNAIVVNTMADLSTASEDNSGFLYYVISEDSFFYSKGTTYEKIDLRSDSDKSVIYIEQMKDLANEISTIYELIIRVSYEDNTGEALNFNGLSSIEIHDDYCIINSNYDGSYWGYPTDRKKTVILYEQIDIIMVLYKEEV